MDYPGRWREFALRIPHMRVWPWVALLQEILSILLLLHSSRGAPALCLGTGITAGVWHGAAGKPLGSGYSALPKGHVLGLDGGE